MPWGNVSGAYARVDSMAVHRAHRATDARVRGVVEQDREPDGKTIVKAGEDKVGEEDKEPNESADVEVKTDSFELVSREKQLT